MCASIYMIYPLDPAQPGLVDLGTSKLSAPNITLHWIASAGYVEKYRIQVTGHTDIYTVGNETVIAVTGLEPGKVYEVRITAQSNSRSSIERVENITTDSERK